MLRLTAATTLAALVTLAAPGAAWAQSGSAEASFREPPEGARPRVWWHWMNGNVSAGGIEADLAWMKRIGIAGVQNFDASLNTPLLVDHRVAFLSPEWRSLFKLAVEGADSLGLEFAIAGSPGWSETGGPWVRPEQAMKKLVWSETQVEGGQLLNEPLAVPPGVTGPYQDMPLPSGGPGPKAPPLPFYRDAVVVAFRTPTAELQSRAQVTASSAVDVQALIDGDRTRPVSLPFGPGDGRSWVQFAFPRRQTIRSLTIVAERAGGFAGFGTTGPRGQIQASDDGRTFRRIADLPVSGAPEHTIGFAATTAHYFRVTFEPRAASPAFFGPPQPPPIAHKLMELSFGSGARVHRFQDKAGWSTAPGVEQEVSVAADGAAVVDGGSVIDLTSRLRPDGSLDWTAPAGRWTILRLGWSLTGRVNHPASPEGTGLEVDKLNRDHVKAYAEAYLGEYRKTIGEPLMGRRGLRYMITDSYEAGPANWTDDILDEFKARRGYDATPWLPVLTGRIVRSADASERFLWDYRKTLGDLIADEHYGQLTESLHAAGMGRYGEAHEDNRAFIGDGMQVKKSADVPMGATWASPPPTNQSRPTNYDADIRESASVAHLYGQNIVAGESLTTVGSAYDYAPERLKPVADRMMANGLNRFIIHTSVHQPVEGPGPGVGLGPFGQWFTRKETWAEQAGPWIDYLARSSALLQQGRFTADLLWFYGEDSNITALYGDRLPQAPPGYAYDFVNADAVLNLLKVQDGRVVTPSGMSYAVLVLGPETHRMSLPVLRRLAELVRAGAVVAGERPETSLSLTDDPAEFRGLADALWGRSEVGKGRIVTGDLSVALSAAGSTPDVTVAGEPLPFVHRTLADADIYFLTNPSDQPRSVDVSFRVANRAPELWRADSASMEALTYRTEGGRILTPLALAPNDAVFVVFRKKTADQEWTAPALSTTVVAELGGSWTLRFSEGRGAPAKIVLPELASWSGHADPGVRYFSGTADYTQTFWMDRSWTRNGARVVIDLGSVKNLAEVRVNGRSQGIAWKPPFKVDVTDALRQGRNTLEVRVTNLWPNRLIGDKQPGEKVVHASATFNPLGADSPLLPSGLLGPVKLVREERSSAGEAPSPRQ